LKYPLHSLIALLVRARLANGVRTGSLPDPSLLPETTPS
jgi:hypothetical protein